jgi:hypothetical protein
MIIKIDSLTHNLTICRASSDEPIAALIRYDKEETSIRLFGETTKFSEGIAIYLSQENTICNVRSDAIKRLEIGSVRNELMLIIQIKS